MTHSNSLKKFLFTCLGIFSCLFLALPLLLWINPDRRILQNFTPCQFVFVAALACAIYSFFLAGCWLGLDMFGKLKAQVKAKQPLPGPLTKQQKAISREPETLIYLSKSRLN